MKTTPFAFRFIRQLAPLGAFLLAGVLTRAADSAPLPTPEQLAQTNTAVIPALSRNMTMHNSFVELAKKGDIDELFLGDSITDWWRTNGKDVFTKYFGNQKVANFGISGETTQQVLWRLRNGEGTGYSPKLVMLMIGTNNLGSNTDDQIAEGVKAVVGELRQDFPAAKILLLGIFPRATPDSPLRARIANINQTIGKLNDLDHVFYLDIGAKFLDAGGAFLPGVFRPDNLHPAAPGYEIWAQAVQAPLANLLKLSAAPVTASAPTASTPPAAATSATEPRPNTAIIPVPQRTEDRLPQNAVNSYLKKHATYVDLAKAGGIDVLFLGDSITDGWHGAGKAVWDQYYGSMKAANFGIGYDRTQHTLWRLQNGEGAGFQPKAVVMMLGTNNTGINTPEEAAAGIAAVVAELRKDFPETKILLLGIFPRGNPGEAGRRQVAGINQIIAKLHDGQHVFYLDIGAKFLDTDGNMLPGVMGDAAKLHPSAAGYTIWAEAIKDPLANLLAGKPAFDSATTVK